MRTVPGRLSQRGNGQLTPATHVPALGSAIYRHATQAIVATKFKWATKALAYDHLVIYVWQWFQQHMLI